MKKIIMSFAALIAAATIVSAQTTTAPAYENAIQVNGKAERKITPDEIYMNITIKDGDVKGQNVNQIESTMKSRLTALGVEVEKNLKVNDMTNAPRKKNQVDTQRSYELKVGDVWTLDSVFEMLGDLGIADASVNRVSHSRMDEFRKEVRIEAIKTAQENARVLAGAVDQEIGPAVWIFDSGNYFESSPVPVLMRSYKAADEAYSANGAEQSIEYKDITLTYSITAKFVLK